MSAPYPPSAGASLQAYLSPNRQTMGSWGPTSREKVTLPGGPFPTAGKQFGSEYFWGAKHTMTSKQKFAMWLIIILILLLLCYFLFMHNKHKMMAPTFYF